MKYKYSLLCLYFLFNFGASQEISAKKCQEYGKAVFVKEESPVLMPNAENNKVSHCGIVAVPLIIGGTKSESKEFPHMVLIGFGTYPEDTIAWSCGGSLISELFVLTAAHCVQSRDKGPAQKILLGLINLDIIPYGPEVQIKTVTERIAHPLHKPPEKYHDIALLRMDSPVQFTEYVRPACLYSLPSVSETSAIATGFGKLSYDAQEGSKISMKVKLSIISNDQCNQYYKGSPFMSAGVDQSMLCAGELQGGKDTCQGDSGGPLSIVLEEPYCMYSLVGVTSYGKFCGFANSPAIYTRVSYYVPWIESIVWQN